MMRFLSVTPLVALLLGLPDAFGVPTAATVRTPKPSHRIRPMPYNSKYPAKVPTAKPIATPQPTRVRRFRQKALALPGKKGAAQVLRPGKDQLEIYRIKLLGAYWNYEWGLPRSPEQPTDVEFIPMVWGASPIPTLEARLNAVVIPDVKSKLVKRLLGYNEPDLKGQADMSPALAISLWPSLQKLNIPLCSPSCASPLSVGSNTWLADFMSEVKARNYRVDYIGVHWYSVPNVLAFQQYLKKVYDLYDRPLLITEFAVADWSATATRPNRFSAAQVLTFMKAVLPWMEAQDWIYGYSWFAFDVSSPPGTSSALFDKGGNLTDCGLYYKSVTKTNPLGDQSIGVVSPTVAPVSPTVTPLLAPIAPTILSEVPSAVPSGSLDTSHPSVESPL